MEIPADKKTRLITLLIGAVQAAGLLVAQLLLIALFWTGQGGPVSQSMYTSITIAQIY
jgi:hypothetical protein